MYAYSVLGTVPNTYVAGKEGNIVILAPKELTF